ncbi:hypothetical protein [Schleiferia thermophila]|nr:hypothetical protein [Schleiferia thermophila]KFD40314.1 hypothetical protein AT05_01590 [Schleiferia thermophila str. Yellowstone]
MLKYQYIFDFDEELFFQNLIFKQEFDELFVVVPGAVNNDPFF